MHISYESGILENPWNEPPSNLYVMTRDPREAPNVGVRLEVQFRNGLPKKVTSDDGVYENALDILVYLNKVAGENGIGRIDIVENRFVGLKVRIKTKHRLF